MQLHCAVRKGRSTGIFHSIPELRASVNGYEGAEYEIFTSKTAALEYMRPASGPEDTLIAYTDGSASRNRYGWSTVIVDGADGAGYGRGYYGYGAKAAYLYCGNVAGETIAALKAMEYAVSKGYKRLLIRHDYTGVADWAVEKYRGNSRVAQSYSSVVERMKAHGLILSFEKIKAHTGDWGNECADRLASRGAAGEVRGFGEEGLLVGATCLPERAKRQTDTSHPPRNLPQGPVALLLDEDVELSCIDSICSMADVLDRMYGNDPGQSKSVHSIVQAAVAQAIPQFHVHLRSMAQKSRKQPVDRPHAAHSTAARAQRDIADLIVHALHHARRVAQLRLRNVAEACGLGVRDLARLERGLVPMPDAQVLLRIARVLGHAEMPELAMLLDLQQQTGTAQARNASSPGAPALDAAAPACVSAVAGA